MGQDWLVGAGGAELVLNGHEHDYERFAPVDSSGTADPARGVTEIIVGTGGAELRDFGQTDPRSVVRIGRTYGVISVALMPSGWTTQFIATDGGVLDSSSGTCQ